jgi:hypothetical protein
MALRNHGSASCVTQQKLEGKLFKIKFIQIIKIKHFSYFFSFIRKSFKKFIGQIHGYIAIEKRVVKNMRFVRVWPAQTAPWASDVRPTFTLATPAP